MFIYLLQLNATGKVISSSIVTITTTCDLHLEEFPFDNQTCSIDFTSFLFNSKDQSFSPQIIADYSYDMGNTEFRINTLYVYMQLYDQSSEQFEMASFVFRLQRNSGFYILMFVVPMWMNFLLRTYAWMTILGKNGVLNGILSFFGLPQVQFLYSEGAVLLGMVYNFLPFMVLPIYTVLMKMDSSLIEAAEDLGGNKVTVFSKVILPLSIPGVLSGVSMVFMPAVSTFVISNLLYGGQYMLIGNLIEQQYLVVNDWNFGSAVAMILMALILISMAVMNKVGGDNPEDRGTGLW